MDLVVFDSLKAEDEPWLAQCYVPPTGFPLMAGWRSALIFGDVGAGKTALRLALEREWCPPGEKPPLLLVRWPMTIVGTSELSGSELVQEHVSQVMDVVARALLQQLARYPTDWGQAPPWAHDTLTWFAQHHLRGDLAHYVASLEGKVPGEGLNLLQDIVTASVPGVLHAGAPAALVYPELVRALHKIGLDGVRILVEGLEPWIAVGLEQLVDTLKPFLSALALFEHPRFAYTILLPAELESPLWSAGSIARRRVDTYTLNWGTEALSAMVERRLALALGEANFALKQLEPTERLLGWLEGCGGRSPRGWLETIRPFFATYLAKAERRGKRTALTTKQCLTAQKRHPPRLFMDADTGRVTVGWREALSLQPGQRVLLEYLYHHRGQLCSRERLYRAYATGLGEEVDDRLFPADYAGRLDNVIYRLRQAIEPDSAHPVLIVTVKGEGYQLEHAW